MRKWILCLAAVSIAACFLGCAEKRDKVRVKTPFVDVRVKEDGSTSVEAPGTDVKVNR